MRDVDAQNAKRVTDGTHKVGNNVKREKFYVR